MAEYNRCTDNYIKTSYYDIKKIVNEVNIPFPDMHNDVFSKTDNPLNYFAIPLVGRGIHYNENGYRNVDYNIYELTNN